MAQLSGIIGIVTLLGVAYFMSNNRKAINYNLILWGIGLQFFFGLFILKTPIGQPFFSLVDKVVKKLISFADMGGDFLFRSFVTGQMEIQLINIAFRILPTIIFFSSLMAVAYHLGIMQFIVKWISKAMQKTLKTSGSETLSVSANIFVGQTESPLMIRPFISNMTQSELMAVMVGGFATVAGGVMAIYVQMLSHVPNIAGHLMAASIMSAPAALVVAKIIYPETESSETFGKTEIYVEKLDDNVMEATARGATDGLKLAANVGGMLIAFVGLIAMTNYILGLVGLSMEGLFAIFFKPLAWSMGIPWEESGIVGMLMGKKIVLTELIAYTDLSAITATGDLSHRSSIIASYALCGFANFASVGIQLGGIGGIAPNRRKDLAKISLKAMFGGALASWLTATVAGLLL